jgi:hypothetical protein
MNDGTQVGPDINTELDGMAQWTSIDFPELTVGLTDLTIDVIAPALYQDRSTPVPLVSLPGGSGLACTTDFQITLAPIETHHCSPCCTIPMPNVLGDLGLESPGAWTKNVTVSAEACGVSTEVNYSILLACDPTFGDYLFISVSYCCTRRTFDVGFDPVFTTQIDGFVNVNLNCGTRIDQSFVFPDDFTLGTTERFPDDADCVPRIDLGTIVIRDDTGAALPSRIPTTFTTGRLCVETHNPPCDPTLPSDTGSLKSGVDVEIRDDSDVLVDSGTTGTDGQFCVDGLTRGATYTIHASDGTCEVTSVVQMPHVCNTNTDRIVIMTVCCGYARITVRRPAGGAVVPGATVTSPILGLTATADGSGVALLGPFGATQMRALPPSGGDCSTRLLSVEASAEGYLSACDLVEVSCGSTGESPAESTVELLPLDTDGDGTPDFVRDTDWCEDRGCLEPSYANRGLLANLRVLVAQMEIWGTDSAWHDVLGGTGNVAINSILYDNLRTGSSGFPESPWEDTPYSAPVPDIEYRATGSHAGTVPSVVRNIGGSCSGIWGAAKWPVLTTPPAVPRRSLAARCHARRMFHMWIFSSSLTGILA